MKVRLFCILHTFLLLPLAQCTTVPKEDNKQAVSELTASKGDTIINRKPAVAGSFYPGNRESLTNELTRLFTGAVPDKVKQHIVALVAPHAGYAFSGLVAASAYNQLTRDFRYDNVFIIGSSHYVSYDGAALYGDGNLITPLGLASVNLRLVDKLISDNPLLFSSQRDVHAREHSIEVQIPYLQYLYKDDLQIVPILICSQKPSTCKKIAEALRPYFNKRNLFVISTDFSHYPGYQDACEVDEYTAAAIVKNSPAEFVRTVELNESLGLPGLVTSICGWTSVLTLLDITEKVPDIQFTRIRYMNSGDVAGGDKSEVVGYHAITLSIDTSRTSSGSDEIYSLSSGEQKQLLRIARNTIKNYLVTGRIPTVDAGKFSDKLLAHSGAFVTLNKNGQLRGCIGQFTAEIPLYQVVQEMAVSSALHDNRFNPLTMEELAQVEIEISVLTPMHKITSVDEIKLGRHGIYIKKGNRAGTFLPQVATQYGWNLQEFLGYCSRDKAGIGWEGWKEAEIFVYEAYVFGEK